MHASHTAEPIKTRSFLPNGASVLPALAVLMLAAGCATPRAEELPAFDTETAAGTGQGEAAATGTQATNTQPTATQQPPTRTAPMTPMPRPTESTMADRSPMASAADLTEVGDRVFFETDSYTLNGEARAMLAAQAQWLLANPGQRVLIAGNCDERGTREYNLALGARRASAARDYLISLGVPASRLDTVSYGKERPIDGRASADGWAINRNAHTKLLTAG